MSTTVKEIVEECAKLAGLEPDDEAALPRLRKFSSVWYGKGDNAATFAAGGAWPLGADMTIVAMFKDDIEIRVYAVPSREPTKPGELVPARYTLLRASNGVTMETLVMDTLKAFIAFELVRLDEDTPGLDEAGALVTPESYDDGDEGDDPTPPTPSPAPVLNGPTTVATLPTT